MAKKKSKPKSPFLGRWHIVWMSGWDEDYFNEEVQAFIEFDDKGGGSFQFGYMRGSMDVREGLRDGQPAMDFSREGGDGADGTPLTGRGWAKLGDEGLEGMFFIHLGDESEFEAERAAWGVMKAEDLPQRTCRSGRRPIDAQEVGDVPETGRADRPGASGLLPPWDAGPNRRRSGGRRPHLDPRR